MNVIALVGENGAGKGMFLDMLKKLLPGASIVSVRFSDVLCDILAILGKEKSRHNIDMLVTALRQAFDDEGILNNAIRKRLKGIEADIIVLDGLRKAHEVSLVREHQGILVYIEADQRVRYERRKQSAEKSDEINMSWEQFIDQSKAPPQITIRHIGETLADFRIENNGSVEDLELNVKTFIKQYHLQKS